MSSLRAAIAEYDALNTKAGKIRVKVFWDTYRWVNETLERVAQCDSIKAGCVRLGNTIRRSYKNIESWYYCGQFMDQNGIDPENACHRSIRLVYQRKSSLARHELLRCVSMMRKNTPYADVARVVNGSASLKAATAERRASRSRNRGTLNRTTCRMEMLACRTFLAEFFNKRVVLVAYDENGNELLESK